MLVGMEPTTEIKVEVIEVTPAQAEIWLGHNSHNRNIRPKKVAELVGAITRGEWQTNGDAIRFDVNGVLLDGQHRLQAIAEAKLPVTSLVVKGLAPEAQETCDMGARRKLGDMLRLRGESAPLTLAAVINGFWRWTNGYVRSPSTTPTVAQAMKTLTDFPDLREATQFAQRFNAHFRSASGPIGACWAVFNSIDTEANDVFWEKLLVGTNLETTHPIWHLREYFIEQAKGQTMRGTRGNAVIMHALIVKAWNAYRQGLEINGLRWVAAGRTAESFPEPIS